MKENTEKQTNKQTNKLNMWSEMMISAEKSRRLQPSIDIQGIFPHNLRSSTTDFTPFHNKQTGKQFGPRSTYWGWASLLIEEEPWLFIALFTIDKKSDHYGSKLGRVYRSTIEEFTHVIALVAKFYFGGWGSFWWGYDFYERTTPLTLHSQRYSQIMHTCIQKHSITLVYIL